MCSRAIKNNKNGLNSQYVTKWNCFFKLVRKIGTNRGVTESQNRYSNVN